METLSRSTRRSPRPGTLALLLVLAGAVACGGVARMMGPSPLEPKEMEDRVRHRAAFDFQCAESDLQLTKLSDRSFGVNGCDKRQVYVLVGACVNWPGATCDALKDTDEVRVKLTTGADPSGDAAKPK